VSEGFARLRRLLVSSKLESHRGSQERYGWRCTDAPGALLQLQAGPRIFLPGPVKTKDVAKPVCRL